MAAQRNTGPRRLAQVETPQTAGRGLPAPRAGCSQRVGRKPRPGRQ